MFLREEIRVEERTAHSRKDSAHRMSIGEKLLPSRKGLDRAKKTDGLAMFPEHICLHRFFEQRVALAPEAVALAQGDFQLSYGELNRRANQLAHHLSALGVGPEVRVGVCLNRSPEMILALLAVLKAGGGPMCL